MAGPTAAAPPRKPIRPLAAIRALRALIANPEDTKQVFLITEALNGNAGRRAFARFRATEAGARILAEKRQLLDTLCDRQRLAALSAGSFGRHYHAFMASEGLTADGLVDASKSQLFEAPSDEVRLFAARERDWHDLEHVLTGYGRDPLGEICVLAFFTAQSWYPGLLLIVSVGMLKIKRELPGQPVMRAVWEAWRNGRKAAWLSALDWEGLLPRPLNLVRQEVGVRPPLTYHRITAALGYPTAVTEDQAALLPLHVVGA
jgi:ubiquinone biosynthesis protein COQ4